MSAAYYIIIPARRLKIGQSGAQLRAFCPHSPIITGNSHFQTAKTPPPRPFAPCPCYTVFSCAMRPENTTENHTPETRPPWRFDRGRARAKSPPPFAACQPFDRAAGFVASLSARHHRTRRPRRALQPFRQMSAATVRQSIRQGFRRPCAAPVSGSTWQPSASLSGDRAPVATIAGNAPQPSALAFLRAAHVRAVTPCRALARPFNTPCNRS